MTGDGPDALVRAQRGDAEAFRLLYRDLQPRLLRYLHALAGQDAEDIASETWLQVTRDLAGFTGSYDGFRGWVATIARHRALDHLRRTTRTPALPVPAEDLAAWPAGRADTAARAIDAVATEHAIALIATLPPDQAEAVLLRAVLGLDATTAGQRPRQTTRRHPHRRQPRPPHPAQKTQPGHHGAADNRTSDTNEGLGAEGREMNTRHYRRISRKAADQLLDGAAGPDQGSDGPPGRAAHQRARRRGGARPRGRAGRRADGGGRVRSESSRIRRRFPE